MSRRAALVLGAAGSLGFLCSCLFVGHGLRSGSLYSDVHVYARYAGAMVRGRVPYRDFFDEYPPLAQLVFLLGRVAGPSHFALAFKATMAACGIGALVCAVWTLRMLHAPLVRSVAAVAVIAVAPVLVGPIFLNAYDLWPAFLLSLAIALLVARRTRLAFAVLGAAVAAKVYPIAVLPVAVLAVNRAVRRSALAWFVGVVVVANLPFAALAPGGLRFSYWVQAKRGLELNSLGAALLLAVGHPRLGFRPPGSLNVLGGPADALAIVSSLLVLAAIAAAAAAFARGLPLVVACAAAVAGFVAFDKVFSAQYVDWLVPLVPLAGLAASALTAAILVLTRLVFSHRDGIAADHAGSVGLLLARDLLVVLVTAWLLATASRRPLRAPARGCRSWRRRPGRRRCPPAGPSAAGPSSHPTRP